MSLWLIYITGSLLLTLLVAGGLLLHRRKQPPSVEARKQPKEDSVLYLLLWLASLSILGYIVFVFGKR
jgi:hypothetical protein